MAQQFDNNERREVIRRRYNILVDEHNAALADIAQLKQSGGGSGGAGGDWQAGNLFSRVTAVVDGLTRHLVLRPGGDPAANPSGAAGPGNWTIESGGLVPLTDRLGLYLSPGALVYYDGAIYELLTGYASLPSGATSGQWRKVSGGGTSSGGGTPPASSTAPPAPTNLRVTSTQDSIALTWRRPVETNVVSYVLRIDGAQASVEPKRTETRTAQPDQTYTYTGLAAGTSYVLDIYSRASDGTLSAKATTTVLTKSASSTSTAPAPTGARRVTATTETIAMAWTRPVETNVARYAVYRDDVRITDFDPAAASRGAQPEQSYTYRNLVAGTSYVLEVASVDSAGIESARSRVIASTETASSAGPGSPAAPTGARAAGAQDDRVALIWTRPDETNVARYVVYLDNVEVADFDPRAEPRSSDPEQSYTYRNLQPGTDYLLAVSARNAAGEESTRSSVTARTTGGSTGTPPTSTTAPPAPTNARTIAESSNSFALVWTRPDETDVDRYVVYLDGVEISDFEPRAEPTSSNPEQSYTFRNLAAGTSYTAGVASRNSAGVVSARAEATTSTTP